MEEVVWSHPVVTAVALISTGRSGEVRVKGLNSTFGVFSELTVMVAVEGGEERRDEGELTVSSMVCVPGSRMEKDRETVEVVRVVPSSDHW